MPECFIIMPVTTPPETYSQYNNDGEHFKHILDHLFIPAVKEMGYTPVPPVVTGADIIHAEIIRQLENAELVLCDISTLNPNVFFELGIRTAVDKPVSIVKDTLTAKIPFDTTLINHYTYDHSLSLWTIQNEIHGLSNHLLQSVNRSDNRNPLWKHFGLTKRAILSTHESSLEEKVDYILLNLEAIKQNAVERPTHSLPSQEDKTDKIAELIMKARQLASEYKARLTIAEVTDKAIVFDLDEFILPDRTIYRIKSLGEYYGVEVKVIGGGDVEPQDIPAA
jgi:hypothetical protein